MAKILVMCPYDTDKEIYKLISPLAAVNDYKMICSNIYGKLLKESKEGKKFPKEIWEDIIALELKLEDEDVIWIGPSNKDNKFDYIICIHPDMVEAQELYIRSLPQGSNLVDVKINSKDVTIKVEKEVDLLKAIKNCIDESRAKRYS